ncbi:MAG: hypothetical protein JSV85_06965 [Candidatus Bathyarchaeota archaeon]|nr:MAG: hypothetical protein JSV85_06965 [Candidatus Bathyarchaeota archaeon]
MPIRIRCESIMKRITLSLPVIIALSILLAINSVVAVVVSVTVDPEVIPHPGGSTTVRVFSSEAGVGSITVVTPVSHTASVAAINVPEGGADSAVYPDDFPGGSTTEIGEYEVTVYLAGEEYKATFWVTFEVIDESPIGTVMAIIAPIGALIGLAKIKRLRKAA